MRLWSKLISYIFHPIFILFYMFILLKCINPYLFNFTDPKAEGLLTINVFIFTVMFPLIATLIMLKLGLIRSLEMKDKMERIGPFIVSAIFYLWLFKNIKDNSNVPGVYTTMVLGSIIGLFIGFAINTVSKISIHTIGVGGLIAGLFLMKIGYSYEYFSLSIPSLGTYLVNVNLILVLGLIIAGAVGTARLWLNAHKAQDVYGGYIVGIFAQVVAIFFIL